MRALVTGANRGLGLEFVRQLLAHGAEVDATARHPEDARELAALGTEGKGTLRILPLDVADPASVRAFASALTPGPLNLVILNAGVGGQHGKSLEGLDLEAALDVLSINALGPLRVAQAILPRLLEAPWKKLVLISSLMGTVSDNGSGGAWAYRMSKAALNMAGKNLHLELAPKGVLTLTLNPGWVRTDLGGPSATLSPEESVRGMLAFIQQAQPEHSGGFFHHDGKRLPL
jgi:NAD(P)-dependent dehydrogenase (short-subunit alcohol dehydrogenase family)